MLPEGLLDARSIVAAIDEALDENVIVTGALPPQGRDLDFLVSDEQARRLPGILAAHGFLPRGRDVAPHRSAGQQWVKIEGCSALAVDLNPMRRWGLPPAEEHALVADAVPMAGFDHLVRPSAHHTILIMARRLATGALSARRLGKLAAAIEEDPLAWKRAEERARAWGVQAALLLLRRVHEGGPELGPRGTGEGAAGSDPGRGLARCGVTGRGQAVGRDAAAAQGGQLLRPGSLRSPRRSVPIRVWRDRRSCGTVRRTATPGQSARPLALRRIAAAGRCSRRRARRRRPKAGRPRGSAQAGRWRSAAMLSSRPPPLVRPVSAGSAANGSPRPGLRAAGEVLPDSTSFGRRHSPSLSARCSAGAAGRGGTRLHRRRARLCGMLSCEPYVPSRSIMNTSVSFGGIFGGEPFAP